MASLDQLLYWRGIASDYYNYKGELTEVPIENRKILLRAMGIDADDPKQVQSETFKLDIEPWTQWVPAFQVIEQHKECCFFVNVHPDDLDSLFTFRFKLEDGNKSEGRFTPALQPEVGDYLFKGVRYSRRVVMSGALPLGYHKLSVEKDKDSRTGGVAVVPEKAYLPSALDQGKRSWGFIVQLYTLRSNRNWGIGDLTDLKSLIVHAANHGADIIGLNPLHVLCTPNEYHYSPYSPSDRRYIDPLYIDPATVPEFSFITLENETELEALRGQSHVDYRGVWAAKYSAYRAMFKVFQQEALAKNSVSAQNFLAFVDHEGEPLHRYCLYQVLRNSGVALETYDGAPLTAEQQEDIDFYAYLQWQAQFQMESCQLLCNAKGMTVGLMRDLAVGADGSGAEVTTNGELFCRQASVGAPPDPLAEKGQNWGIPPMDPAHLRRSSFEHFINLLRTNMEHCGALRIDHAMALMRLWWCPPGKTADHGAYIYYPFPEMLGLLKLESVRNQCMVVGEDMGVVPDEFRSAIIEGSVFTNKLFYFEREHDHSFKLPQNYMSRALAMLTNHDVPTLTSWWAATDLTLRNELDLLDDSVPFDDVINERQIDKHRLLDWIEACGGSLPVRREQLIAQPLSKELLAQIVECGAQVCSQLYVVQLEDLELLDAPVNVPGTSSQYRNWQRKLTKSLDEVFGLNHVIEMLNAVSQTRSAS